MHVESIFMWYKMPSTVNDFYVRVGDNVMEVEDEEEQELAILKIDFHENYNVGPEYNNDIAVVHIDRAKHPHGIRFGDKVVPVCLPQVRSQKYFSPTLRNIFPCQVTADYSAPANVTVSGWGSLGRDSAASRAGPANFVSQVCEAYCY